MCVFKCRKCSYAFGGKTTCFSRYPFNGEMAAVPADVEELIVENKIYVRTNREMFL